MPGAQLGLLEGVFRLVTQHLLHLFSGMPNDHHRLYRGNLPGGFQGIPGHGLAQNLVKHLGQVGFHARALPGGKDNGGKVHHPSMIAKRKAVWVSALAADPPR